MNTALLEPSEAAGMKAGFLHFLERLILTRWEEWELPGSPSRGMDFILMGAYPPLHKVVVCMSRETRRPVAVAKVSRRWDRPSEGLQRHHRLLRELVGAADEEYRGAHDEQMEDSGRFPEQLAEQEDERGGKGEGIPVGGPEVVEPSSLRIRADQDGAQRKCQGEQARDLLSHLVSAIASLMRSLTSTARARASR